MKVSDQGSADDHLRLLGEMVSTLQAVESGLARLHAVREYTLAMASALAGLMAHDDGGPRPDSAPPGFDAASWDSRSAELAQRSVAAELAVATRRNDRSLQHQMLQASELLGSFPATFAALSEGLISLEQARVVQDVGRSLSDPAALPGYEQTVLTSARTQTAARLRRTASRVAERTEPESLQNRHDRAAAERRVWVTPLPNGMAELCAVLPAVVAHGIHDRLTSMARLCSSATSPGSPPQTLDQLRAELLSDLLLSAVPTAHDGPAGPLSAITARVDLTVPVLGLVDRGALPSTVSAPDAAEIVGGQSVDPETVRCLLGQAGHWNRVLTDPVSGAVLAVDRYRPSSDLRRLLTARDSCCRFPGCGVPARELDLDHTRDAALGGLTTAGNLAGLCRRHHMLKHHSRWTVKQDATGTLVWTSPAGHRYRDRPPLLPGSVLQSRPGRRAPQKLARQGCEDPPPF